MQWTKDKPTEGGFYFYKAHLSSYVHLHKIYKYRAVDGYVNRVHFIASIEIHYLDDFKGYWIGPFTAEDLMNNNAGGFEL